MLLDDNVHNIYAARMQGWRAVLVDTTGRDCGKPIASEHAELQIATILDVPDVLPELFVTNVGMGKIVPDTMVPKIMRT